MEKEKNKCDVKKDFSSDEIYEAWGKGKPLEYKCKKYHVGRMSYGTFFLEPIEERKYKTEKDRFSNKTLWLKKTIKKNKAGENVVFLEVDE